MNSSPLKLIICGAIIAIYLDWTRLFADIGSLAGLIINQTQELTDDKAE